MQEVLFDQDSDDKKTVLRALFSIERCYKMQLFIQGQELRTFNVTEETTFDHVKSELVGCEGIPMGDQVLSYAGVPLEGDSLVCDTVPELATLSLSVRVLGGKRGILISAHHW